MIGGNSSLPNSMGLGPTDQQPLRLIFSFSPEPRWSAESSGWGRRIEKQAVAMAIANAKGEWILTTDGDCRVGLPG